MLPFGKVIGWNDIFDYLLISLLFKLEYIVQIHSYVLYLHFGFRMTKILLLYLLLPCLADKKADFLRVIRLIASL